MLHICGDDYGLYRGFPLGGNLEMMYPIYLEELKPGLALDTLIFPTT